MAGSAAQALSRLRSILRRSFPQQAGTDSGPNLAGAVGAGRSARASELRVVRKIQSAGFALIWASTVLMLPLMSRAASYCYSTEGFPSALDNESKHRLGEYVARAVYEIEGASGTREKPTIGFGYSSTTTAKATGSLAPRSTASRRCAKRWKRREPRQPRDVTRSGGAPVGTRQNRTHSLRPARCVAAVGAAADYPHGAGR